MADIALGVYEYEKHKHNEQQQYQQLQQPSRDLSSSMATSTQVYNLPQHELINQQQQQLQQQPINQLQQLQTVELQQLSMQDLNPFPESVFSYTLFLASTLVLWVIYLILPRGVRKQYFRANRKRYARRLDDGMPAAGYWMPVQTARAQSNAGESSTTLSAGTLPPKYTSSVIQAAARRQREQQRKLQGQYGGGVPASIQTSPLTPQDEQHQPSPPRHAKAMLKHPPSPEHPALKKIPPNKIIAETMARLQGRGIRLVAHGVHCDPKRVWIRLQDTNNASSSPNRSGTPSSSNIPSVTWQTEFPRRVPDQNGNVSIVLMRGSLHSIGLQNILYIDVGKKTHALQLTKGVPDSVCLSLLTQNGSLDLQANSKLERDSLVSCFSMILDDIHEEDWRAIYEASPEPSLANSSTAFGSGNNHSYLHRHLEDSRNMSTTPGSSTHFQTPSPSATPGMTQTLDEKDRMLQLL